MEVVVKENYDEISKLAAQMIADLIRKKKNAVLGLATGSTPLGTYKELVRMHKEEGLDFSGIITFNLDEYVGLPPLHPESYRYFMNTNLFDQINVKKENTNVPDGNAEDQDLSCQEYEDKIKKMGGLDIQLLGIGGNGHIAFNEPGSSLSSRTRTKTLTEKTRQDNARFFNNDITLVPKYAVTMGIGTIMDAGEIILLANGTNKADAVAQAVEGPVSSHCPASALQSHKMVTMIFDKEAASKLKDHYPTDPVRNKKV
ncbi:MAG: glucosamine-6-phosphate deaminase [Spirochaetes bacterium]|nr:glucosamine-6-phosphate deaminase [Spirochaetota bacterium]